MQMEIGRLVNYFDGIHTVIENICRSQCEKFLNTIKDSIDQSSYEQRAIAISITDMQAQVSNSHARHNALYVLKN